MNVEYVSFLSGFLHKRGREEVRGGGGGGGGIHLNVQTDRIFRVKFRVLVPLGNWLNTLKRTRIIIIIIKKKHQRVLWQTK